MPLDLSIDASSPVMISGATGYVAGQIVKGLLEAGVTVHAPVRDPSRADKLKYLSDIAEKTPGEIRYFKADLLQAGSYAEAMEGCRIVLHTASPFSLSVKDPQKELVDPALLGTRNVLGEANRHESVQRVVLTSSCAAIFGDNTDVAKASDGVLTEEDWNTTSSLSYGPYSYSKTVAEQEAWKIANAQSRWELVVINPSMIRPEVVHSAEVHRPVFHRREEDRQHELRLETLPQEVLADLQAPRGRFRIFPKRWRRFL